MAGPPRPADDPEREGLDTVLYRTPVGNRGQEVVVVRGPDRPPALVGFIKSTEAVKQAAAVYPLRVELRTPSEATLTLGSALAWETATDVRFRRDAVLAAEVVPDGVDLVIAQGRWIGLWRVAFGSNVVLLQMLGGWSDLQAPYTVAGSRTTAKLSRTGDGRCRVAIHEGDTGLTTTYEQPTLGDLNMAKVKAERGADNGNVHR